MKLSAPIAALAVILSAVPLASQAPATLLGSWRADQALPNGIVQTFRFDKDGSFELASALVVDGTYQVEGDRLIQTVALPGSGIPKSDTATMHVSGDSLVVSDPAAPANARTLRRSGVAVAGAAPIVGDWTIGLTNGSVANYRFDRDGSVHVRAQVATERGTYTVTGDTLRLTDDRTFQLPAVTHYAVTGSVLTLTPPTGHGARQFTRVSR